MKFSAKQIIEIVDGSLEGNSNLEISKFSKLNEGDADSISFLPDPSDIESLYTTKSSIVFVPKDIVLAKPVDATLIRVENPLEAFSKIFSIHTQEKLNKTGISKQSFISQTAIIGENVYAGEFAFVGENAKIGNNVKIYPQVYVGDNVIIGDNTTLFSGVKIYSDCRVGNSCVIHSSTVIGSDGFKYHPAVGPYIKKIALGNVVIEDDVEIGANCSIDKAFNLGSTIIRKGGKLDNLIHIAHDVEIGENTSIAAQNVFAGFTKVGKNCKFSGQVGTANFIEIADNTTVAGQSGVTKSVTKPGQILMGTPAIDITKQRKALVHFRNLENMASRLDKLEGKTSAKLATTSLQDIAKINKIDEIYQFTLERLKHPLAHQIGERISLFNGNMGIALFLYQYAQFKPSTRDYNYNLIGELVEEAFDAFEDSENLPGNFCMGTTGTLWALNFLKEKQVIDLDEDYVSQDLLGHLEKGSILDTLQNNNCDLLHGGFGFLAYVIDNPQLPDREKLIQHQLAALAKIAIPVGEDKLNWRISPKYLSEGGQITEGVNLGLAHGICGIVILLAKLKQSGYSSEFVDESVRKGLNFIYSNKLKNVVSSSLYPILVTNNSPVLNGRLGWCYGDFCVALAHWHGWKATGNEAYKMEALEIMDHAARLAPEKASAFDCGLCHGTAGISHIFRKFYLETKKELYKQAADFWMERTIVMGNHADGYAGYKVYRTEKNGGWTADAGVLEGVAGIGLSLISSFTNTEGDWDKFLLIG